MRNSGRLGRDIVACQGVEALVRCVQTDGVVPKRTALFSLGNLAAYPDCRVAVMSSGIVSYVANELRDTTDMTLKKYANRLLTKCNAL